MVIENNTLVTLAVLVLLLISTGLIVTEHRAHVQRFDALNQRLDESDKKIAGMERTLKMHTSR